jgi:hypothetical protein
MKRRKEWIKEEKKGKPKSQECIKLYQYTEQTTIKLRKQIIMEYMNSQSVHRNRSRDTAHNLTWSISLDYIILQMKSIVTWQTTGGCRILTNNPSDP